MITNEATDKLAVANEISRQIGGRAFFMMGTNHKLGGENFLQFNLRGSPLRVNKIKVILTPLDTYTVEFWKVPVGARAILNGKVPVLVASVEDVYCDGLHQVIEANTALRLSL